MRKPTGLTDKYIQSLKPIPGKGRYDEPDAGDTRNMRIRIEGNPTSPLRAFVYLGRFRPGASPTRRKLGEYVNAPVVERKRTDEELLELEALTLSEARAKARLWKAMLKAGIDPADDLARRRQERAAHAEAAAKVDAERRENTVDKVMNDFSAEKLAKQRKGRDVERNLRNVFLAAWSGRTITDITELDVLKIINPRKGDAPEYARNLLNDCRQLFRFAIGARVYGITVNPCASLKPSDIIGKKRRRTRVLSNDELFAFWRAVHRLRYPHRQVYELLVLTALRLNAVAQASWTEFPPAVVRALRRRRSGEGIDWSHVSNEPLAWVIPAARMKGEEGEAQDFLVPLTPQILKILEGLPLFGGDFVFSTTHGRRPVSVGSKVKETIDRRMLRTLKALARMHGDDPKRVAFPHWVNHDIRRTVRSNLSRLRVTEEAREAVLAHVRPGIKGVYDLYDYADEKREALELWAAQLRSIAEPKAKGATLIAAE